MGKPCLQPVDSSTVEDLKLPHCSVWWN